MMIGIDEDLNPEYFGLIERGNALSDRIGDLLVALRELDALSMDLQESREVLLSIIGQIQAIEQDLLAWSHEAWNFANNPHFAGLTTGWEQTQFLHYTASLRSIVSTVMMDFSQLRQGVQLREMDRRTLRSDQQTRKALRISSLSFWISGVSLLLALLAFLGVGPTSVESVFERFVTWVQSLS